MFLHVFLRVLARQLTRTHKAGKDEHGSKHGTASSQVSDDSDNAYTVGQNVTVSGQLISTNMGLVNASGQTITLTYPGNSGMAPVTAVTNLDGTFDLEYVHVLGQNSQSYTVGVICDAMWLIVMWHRLCSCLPEARAPMHAQNS